MTEDILMCTFLEDAERNCQILLDNGIEAEIREVKPSVDVTFTNNLKPEYWIRVHEDQAENARRVLDENDHDAPVFSEDHYMHEFTKEELIDVLHHYYDWGAHEYKFARKLLENNGKVYSDSEIDRFKEEHLKELREPTNGNPYYLLFGFFLSALGGAIGIFMGYHYWTDVKKLPTGEKVSTYTESTRNKGKLMLYLGLFILFANLTYYIWFF